MFAAVSYVSVKNQPYNAKEGMHSDVIVLMMVNRDYRNE
jgi:hypothetical protein